MPVRKKKRCPQCRESKPLKEFYLNRSAPDGHHSYCIPCARSKAAGYRARNRELVFGHFGRECACCGTRENLTLDHVHGGGKAHRDSLGCGESSFVFYYWLVSNNFPAECEPGGKHEIQVLCSLCNSTKGTRAACTADHSRGRARMPEPERDARIAELRGEGLSQPVIAAEVGWSQPTVSRVLSRA